MSSTPSTAFKRFNKVNIEISNICNLQCTFCPEVIRSKKMMDVALFESIIEQVAPLTEQVTFHLMGEPLVHPKLEELIQTCARHEVPIYLVSNGTLLKEAQSELLLHPIFRQINFSLHSFFDNFPERDPLPYLNRIFEFTDRALKERPDLYLNFRLWNLSNPESKNLAAEKRNLEMLEQIEAHFKVQVPRTIDVSRNKSVKLGGRLYMHFDTEFIWPSPDLPILGERGTCHGLSSHFGILVDGTVVPCCLDKEGNIPLGRVQEQPITEIINSPRAKKILEGFRNRKLYESLCQRCQYITRFD